MPPEPPPSRVPGPDAIFAALAAAHDGLDEAASLALMSRLNLLLATRLDPAEVIEAINAARAAR